MSDRAQTCDIIYEAVKTQGVCDVLDQVIRAHEVSVYRLAVKGDRFGANVLQKEVDHIITAKRNIIAARTR